MPQQKTKKSFLPFSSKAGLFFICLSTLLLEFTFIRLLSVALWYHFAFMIISIAMLGFGISGVVIYLYNKKFSNTGSFIGICSFLYGVSVLVSFLIINKIPFDP